MCDVPVQSSQAQVSGQSQAVGHSTAAKRGTGAHCGQQSRSRRFGQARYPAGNRKLNNTSACMSSDSKQHVFHSYLNVQNISRLAVRPSIYDV